VRSLFASVAALLLVACQTAATAGSSCALRSDCADPLICAGGRCRTECAESIDCLAGWSCASSGTAHVLACLPPSSPVLCAYNSECPTGSFCVDHQCRAQCRTDRDCASGTCNDGTCTMPITTAAASDAGGIEAGACTTCGGRCVDLMSDAQHCGACGNACPAGNACANGQCVAGGNCDDAGTCCSGSTAPCGGACVDTLSDPHNCAACGRACASGVCRNGTCADVNDDCAHAIPIDVSSGSGSATVTITEADAPSGGSCDQPNDVYFSFTLTQRSLVLADAVSGASIELTFRTSCDAASIGCGLACHAEVFDPGTHYVVASATVSGIGTGSLQIYTLPITNAIAGELAVTSTGGMQTFTGTTAGAMHGASCGAGPDAVYFIAACTGFPSGTLTADTCTGTSFPSTLGVVTTNGTAGACTSAPCGTGGQRITYPLSDPGIYAIYVGGVTASDSGSFTLNAAVH
jgi:hypothetical protein